MASSELSDGRRITACCCATLLSYIGLVHEVAGTRLFPNGMHDLGGAVPWHALGTGGIVGGVLLVLGVLGRIRVPLRLLAGLYVIVGIAIVILEFSLHGDFHFFAASVATAAGIFLVAVSVPERVRRTSSVASTLS
jgi:hypothetical protein